MLGMIPMQLIVQRTSSAATCQAAGGVVPALQVLRACSWFSTGQPPCAPQPGGSEASASRDIEQQHHVQEDQELQNGALQRIHILLDDDATAVELEQGAQQLQRQGYTRINPSSSLARPSLSMNSSSASESSSSRLNEVTLDQIMSLSGHEDMRKALVQAHREGAPARVQEALDRMAAVKKQGMRLDPSSETAVAQLQAEQLHALCRDFDISVRGNGGDSWQAAAAQAIAQLVSEQRLQQGLVEVTATSTPESDEAGAIDSSSTDVAASSSAGNSGSSSSSGSSSRDMEALVDQLFDADLQQRLASASAAVAASASSSATLAAPANSHTSSSQQGGAMHSQQLEESAGPSMQVPHPVVWHAVPGGNSNPWAPLPDAAAVRAAVRARVLVLLAAQQRRAPSDVAAAGAAGTADVAEDEGDVVAVDAAALMAVSRGQLEEALSDCGAAMHGSKEELAARLAAVLWGSGAGSVGDADVLPMDASDAATAARTAAQRPSRQAGAQTAASERRNQVMAAAAQRRELLSQVVDVQEVGRWLLAAHMQDVCILDVRAQAGAAAQQYVLATGMSDRHVAASVSAVRWQLKQRLAALGEAAQPLVRMEVPAVVGSAESEWVALDAGDVVVHAFTERARTYYDIEGLLREQGGVAMQRLEPEGQQVMTKNSITLGAAAAGDGGHVHGNTWRQHGQQAP